MVAWFVGSLILYVLEKAIDEAWDRWKSNNEEHWQDACNFYEDYREDSDFWGKSDFWDLGRDIYESEECPYLFDKHRNDYDEENKCYIWDPEYGDVGNDIEICSAP